MIRENDIGACVGAPFGFYSALPLSCFFYVMINIGASQVAQWQRIHLPVQETEMRVRFLGQKVPWSRKWQRTPVYLPEKLHGQRSLLGSSAWGCRLGYN